LRRGFDTWQSVANGADFPAAEPTQFVSGDPTWQKAAATGVIAPNESFNDPSLQSQIAGTSRQPVSFLLGFLARCCGQEGEALAPRTLFPVCEHRAAHGGL
jgi:hypothetical protein